MARNPGPAKPLSTLGCTVVHGQRVLASPACARNGPSHKLCSRGSQPLAQLERPPGARLLRRPQRPSRPRRGSSHVLVAAALALAGPHAARGVARADAVAAGGHVLADVPGGRARMRRGGAWAGAKVAASAWHTRRRQATPRGRGPSSATHTRVQGQGLRCSRRLPHAHTPRAPAPRLLMPAVRSPPPPCCFTAATFLMPLPCPAGPTQRSTCSFWVGLRRSACGKSLVQRGRWGAAAEV